MVMVFLVVIGVVVFLVKVVVERRVVRVSSVFFIGKFLKIEFGG